MKSPTEETRLPTPPLRTRLLMGARLRATAARESLDLTPSVSVVLLLRILSFSIPIVDNYMDYSYDVCLTEFSAGQIERLQEQMRVYRGVDITIV